MRRRLIDANMLKAEFTGNFQKEYGIAQIKAMIDTQPTIEAEPVKHGYWATGETITFGGRTASPLFCSECLKVACGEPWTYCPNCGAKMDGGEK